MSRLSAGSGKYEGLTDITRRPGRSLARGETKAQLGFPDHSLALRQFTAYTGALKDCGLEVQVLDALEDFPDAHFVEDTAVVTNEMAVLSRPGAASRRQESKHMAPELARFRTVIPIENPGTLDGGDVLMVGSHFLVGVSDRTNEQGAGQLGGILVDHGYTWQPVPVGDGLHLKSSVNHVGGNTLLVTPGFADCPALGSYEKIVVPADEEYACNTLLINDRLIMPEGYPETRKLLEAVGLPVIILDTSEFRKMDGGLTCLSLRF